MPSASENISMQSQAEEPLLEEAANNSEKPGCYLHVISGRSAGQQFLLPFRTQQLCGPELENDIILPGSDSDAWQVSVQSEGKVIRVEVLAGEVQVNDETLASDAEYVLEKDTVLSIGDFSFALLLPKVSPQLLDALKESDAPANKRDTRHSSGKSGNDWTRKILYGVSILCVVFGVLSAMYAVTGSLILANSDSDKDNDNNNFAQLIGASEISHLQVEQAEGSNSYTVSGAVTTREDINLLNRIARDSNVELVNNVRVNDVVSESVEDIFRVNGIQSDAQISPDGGIVVYTNTSDTLKLSDLRKKVSRDLPGVGELEIINTEPVLQPVTPKGRYKPKPEKRITLISAGENAYIMTKDKSRYFVGALLPSGHLIEEIREGEVIVSKNGKRETLKY